ncbi:MAG: hypothetical protein ACOH2H_26450, partial [Cypionkella sp.]
SVKASTTSVELSLRLTRMTPFSRHKQPDLDAGDAKLPGRATDLIKDLSAAANEIPRHSITLSIMDEDDCRADTQRTSGISPSRCHI